MTTSARWVLGSALLVLALAACSSSGGSSAASTPAASSTQATATASATGTPAGGGATPNTAAITLPETLGDLGPMGPAPSGVAASSVASVVAKSKAWLEALGPSVKSAYGGAGTDVRTYYSPDMVRRVLVIAVRSWTPGLYTTSRSAELDGLAQPLEEVSTFGPVQCLVRHDAVAAGGTPAPAGTHVAKCQQADQSLTVAVTPAGDLAQSPDKVAEFVKAAWAAVGGA